MCFCGPADGPPNRTFCTPSLAECRSSCGMFFKSWEAGSCDTDGGAPVPILSGGHWVPRHTRWDDGDQICGGRRAPFNEWNSESISTTSDLGGCLLSWGIFDTDKKLATLGAKIFVTFADANNPTGECGNLGKFQIPTTETPGKELSVLRSPYLILDTDNRSSWCNLTFSIEGSDKVSMDVAFRSTQTGNDAGQCKNQSTRASPHHVTVGHPLTIGLNTDDRGGYCKLDIKLNVP
jgi:hypothetical protein